MERKVMKSDGLSQALKKITYGFYILTSKKSGNELSTRQDDYIAAGLVNWVSQGSFDPPLVTVAVQRQSNLHETIEKSRVFAINIIGKNEREMLSSFAKKSHIEGDTINGYSFHEGETGSPIIDEVPAYFECKLVEEVKIGDHTIFVGQVVGGNTRDAEAIPIVEWETNLHYGG